MDDNAGVDGAADSRPAARCYTGLMPANLIITNGDSAVVVLKQSGIAGEMLPWRDVLHDGPVPGDMGLSDLSVKRARFLVDRGWANPETAGNSFTERNATLEQFSRYGRITLWFEHDLYDQLQILQILDWFAGRQLGNTELGMVCTDQYLGMIDPAQVSTLALREAPVTREQLQLAARAWKAFTAKTPQKWHGLLAQDTTALAYLGNAVQRQLEEYPSTQTGLSRTQQTILELLHTEPKHGGRLFGDYRQTEEAMFMGDLSFWEILSEMLRSSCPLLALPAGRQAYDPRNPDDAFRLTDVGKDVLLGNTFWLDHHVIDRWIGGVHLRSDNLWFFERETSELIEGS